MGCSAEQQRKHQSSTLLALYEGNPPVISNMESIAMLSSSAKLPNEPTGHLNIKMRSHKLGIPLIKIRLKTMSSLMTTGRTCRHGYLDHAFMLHCKILPQCGGRHASMNPANAFSGNFANNGRRNFNSIFKSMCNVPKKPFLKPLSISNEILSKLAFVAHLTIKGWHQRVSRTMGSEWPDKRDKPGFGSVTGDGGKFFHVVILPSLTVWALEWFE